jgi:hypothetical protein
MNSAVSTGKGFAPGGVSDTGRVADTYFAAEGHGTYKAKWRADDDLWLEEFDRLRLPLFGLGAAPKRPAGEKAWFVVDSWCRQHIWGSWRQGDYKSGGKLPELDPQAWPTRAAYQTSCNALVAPPKRPVAS